MTDEPVVRTRYRIYIIQHGLLKQPQELYYGRNQNAFSDFETFDEAVAAIAASDSNAEHTVLPIVEKEWR